ncbi:MAG TPA: glycosyltransferase family 2 protein [Candidatus Thermoplasmatota archaeon]|nr:glycosyltransferase family 2 protein [Candidatus Thermoplasmatota archaeon]
MGPFLSAVVITRNEERNLPNALRSLVGWVDEIVVADSASTDGTVAIAERAGCRVLHVGETLHVDAARAQALAEARGKWILSLDADEVVTPALARRIPEWLADRRFDAYCVPRLNHAFGASVHGARWGPDDDRPIALFRRGAIRATREVHEFYHPEPGTRVARLPYVEGEHILHFGTRTYHQLLEKTNRYTSLAAIDEQSKPLPSPRQALTAAARHFLYLYVRKGGRRDGWRGVAICVAAAFYQVATYAKRCELAEGLDDATVRARYQEIVDRCLQGTGNRMPQSDDRALA